MRAGGTAASEAAGHLVSLRPERVVFAHGQLFEGDAAEKLARSLSWLVGKGGTP